MAIKTYNVVKDYYLIDAFYPLGSTVITDEVIAQPYIDLGVLVEQAPPPPEEPQEPGENKLSVTKLNSKSTKKNK